MVGLGALGSVAADLLARAGVGRLQLVDRDVVELENLQRQILYSEADIDRPKADAAADRLRAVNSEIGVEGIARDVHAASVQDLMHRADVIVDGTDNFETRFLLNEAAVKAGIPFVYAGAIASHGMVFATRPPDTACFRCLNPKTPPPGSLPTCETAGIFNAVSSLVGAIEAGEVLRLLLGHPPSGDLLVVDGWFPDVQRIRVARRADCLACAKREYEFLGARRSQVLTSLCGRDTVSLDPLHRGRVDLEALARRLRKVGRTRRAGGLLVADIEKRHFTIFPDGRALIRGVADETEARSVYAKYVGI